MLGASLLVRVARALVAAARVVMATLIALAFLVPRFAGPVPGLTPIPSFTTSSMVLVPLSMVLPAGPTVPIVPGLNPMPGLASGAVVLAPLAVVFPPGPAVSVTGLTPVSGLAPMSGLIPSAVILVPLAVDLPPGSAVFVTGPLVPWRARVVPTT